MLKKLLGAAAIATSLFAVSSVASATTLSNWFIDTDGAGGNKAVKVFDYLDLNGQAYVNNTFTSATTFNFQEVGTFKSNLADSLTGLSPDLNSYFIGTGSGTTGGDLSFNTGSLNVFSGATSIGNFTLTSGSTVLNANSTLPNGTVSFVFRATSMAAGYFFDENMLDLSLIANSPDGLLLGFATTNVINLAKNGATVRADLITDYNAAFGTSLGTVLANQTSDLYLGNNGQFRLEVPEPSMLSLLGLALVGVGFTTRRKNKAKSI